MTALSLLALAAAVLLVPLPAVQPARARALAARGRLVPPHPPASRRWPRPVDPPAAAAVGCAACGTAGIVLAGPAVGVAAAVAAGTVAVLVIASARRRQALTRQKQLLVALRLLVAELEAGARPPAALDAAAGACPHHAAVLAAAARTARDGGSIADTLLRSGAAELAPLGHAWQVADGAGTPIADVLARVAEDLLARAEQQHAVDVALSGPRSSALLLAGLPALGIALGAAMGARPLPFLLGSASGRALCCAGVLLDAAGVLWTQRLTQRAQRA
ncbi:MAG: type II secretion system F family protein [Jatrophihabitantaceae bacterium]